LEVPELADGVIEIRAIARDAGHRTKIAVLSNDANVDPVGACVGARGSRVRQVVNELRGEKVDIVEWRDDTRQFIAEALSPAKVRQVILDDETRTATVVVPDHQLSLAIGKEGQNARLAARLSGYRVDIRSETEQAGGPASEAPAAETTAPAAALAAAPESEPVAESLAEAAVPAPPAEAEVPGEAVAPAIAGDEDEDDADTEDDESDEDAEEEDDDESGEDDEDDDEEEDDEDDDEDDDDHDKDDK
jgi:N utilization substance protein A